MKHVRVAGAAIAAFVMSAPAIAQETPGEAVEALYDVISGPVGEARDWDRFRAMFLDGAQMTVLAPMPEGEERVVTLTIEDYVSRNAGRLSEMGFTEAETRRQTHVYGGLATVLSAYEAIRADTGETFATGVNTIVLARQDGVWKVASLAWRSETEDWPVERAFEAQ
ncbi:hypothetical protein [Oceanicaulis sp. MMSF_3324]|uniref:hypothetical protein n=1 Tax=Oceanicaulis sp. MMSF_3324 TaxID=3046702 RepID=UPI00273FCE97|nr:hypothetical protein [Oceanicaulis sp. MMSF_3324]